MHQPLILAAMLALGATTTVFAVDQRAASTGATERFGTSSSSEAFVDDAILTTQVKVALFDDPALSTFNVKVRSQRGHVILSGTVSTAEERTKAIQIVAGVRGVKNVHSAIVIKEKARARLV
ncbi:hypothetical protein JHS3_16800 [Jeongeupia sp. HS-3]|uniref:BON domain-containing protein n=1 Tax=Jeongeupia sp. HS-3 TaxID=1009682 RepID=UPI0018A4DBB7|nr:BON domain-containing protein [Jeongeupia sp. HS-3]BCL75944.1 hypothetical protein JHS3_16800 [Jeongeupia sp. HS-3]